MFSGIVVRGDGIGAKTGYLTANLDTPKRKVDLDSGVYAVWVDVRKKKYKGALAIRNKPWKVEVHLLDYLDEDFYGVYIEIEPIQKVSEMCGFNSKYELREKILQDIKMVRDVLKYPTI